MCLEIMDWGKGFLKASINAIVWDFEELCGSLSHFVRGGLWIVFVVELYQKKKKIPNQANF